MKNAPRDEQATTSLELENNLTYVSKKVKLENCCKETNGALRQTYEINNLPHNLHTSTTDC